MSDAAKVAVDQMLAPAREDLSTARGLLQLALTGKPTDLHLAASLIDHALESLCPHRADTLIVKTVADGVKMVTCPRCHATWHDDQNRLASRP